MQVLVQSCGRVIGPIHRTASKGAADWTHELITSEKQTCSLLGVVLGLILFAV